MLDIVKLMQLGAAATPIVKVRLDFCWFQSSILWDQFGFLLCPLLNCLNYRSSAHFQPLSLLFCVTKLFVLGIWKLFFHPLVLAKDCGPIEAPSNGSMFGNLTVYPHEVSFDCDQGFILSGSSIRRCTSEGAWSGTPASCEGMKSRATRP